MGPKIHGAPVSLWVLLPMLAGISYRFGWRLILKTERKYLCHGKWKLFEA